MCSTHEYMKEGGKGCEKEEKERERGRKRKGKRKRKKQNRGQCLHGYGSAILLSLDSFSGLRSRTHLFLEEHNVKEMWEESRKSHLCL